MKEIKTKQATKDIKVLDKAMDVSRKAKNAYIKTKEQTEQLRNNKDGNYVDDAANNVQQGTETIIRKTGHTAGTYGKKTVEKIQECRTPDVDASETAKRKLTLSKPNKLAKRRFVQSRAKQQFIQTREIQAANQKTVQTRAQQQTSRSITTQTVQRPLFQPAKKTAMQTIHTSGKTGHTIKQSAKVGNKTIKGAAKGTVKTAQRTVKTAEHTARATIKTSQAAAKTAAKTAQTAQRAAQAARAAARMAAVSAKNAAKAMAATIRVIIAAIRSLITLITVGGWIAVVIILVICLAGLLLGSVYGVFFSNESSSKNTPIMTEAVSQLNEEFKTKIEQIQDENPHDTLDLSDNGSSTKVGNWRDILAIYAVKTAANPENGMEVSTLDDAKVGILRNVFWDMNKIDYWTETVEHKETVTTTDKDGNEINKTVTTTEIILHIKVTSKSYSDMIGVYNFNAEQLKMLNELMQDEYRQLFMQLIGS